MSEILVNHEAVINEANAIKMAAQFFSYKTLHNADTSTTIMANANGKSAYYDSQQTLSSLRSGIEKEVKNVKKMDQEYLRCDNAIANATKVIVETSTNGI